MNGGRQFVVFLAVVLVLLSGLGCTKKKKGQLPRQAMAPAEPVPSSLPPEISEKSPPPPPPAPAPEEPRKAEETKPQPAKHHRKKQPQTSTTAQNNGASGNQTAVARPPANPAGEPNPDIAIAPDVSTTQLLRQKRSTEQLLDSTEKTLNGLHNLSHDEELMVTEIRSYVTQSRKATTDGDFERAYNLATKALVKK